MANGLYSRMVDPSFATPGAAAASPNAGVGAPAAGALPRQQQDDSFDAIRMAGLLGMMARQKKPGEEGADAAPGQQGASGYDISPYMPGGQGGSGQFDMAGAMPGMAGAPAPDAAGGFQLPQGAVPGADLTAGIPGAGVAPMAGNFGPGVPAGGMGAILPGGTNPTPESLAQFAQGFNLPWMNGGFGG